MTGGPWTDADDQLLCDLAIEGKTVPQIAERLSRSSGSVTARMHRKGLKLWSLRAESAGARARPCLCCNTKFVSEGAHNRLCDRCRGLSDDTHSILSGGR